MRCPRFFFPELPRTAVEVALPDSVFRHAVQVLRLKPGSPIRLFDGQGYECQATLVDVQRREARVILGEQLPIATESNLSITLLQGISRGERMDFAIQKAVELGVTRIMPVITERCNAAMDSARANKRHMHWQGVIISACEQSGRSVLPELMPVTSWIEALSLSASCKIVLSPEATQTVRQLQPANDLALLIGPEGGLTELEVTQAIEYDFNAILFGPRILRTETASAAALAVLQSMWGDLG